MSNLKLHFERVIVLEITHRSRAVAGTDAAIQIGNLEAGADSASVQVGAIHCVRRRPEQSRRERWSNGVLSGESPAGGKAAAAGGEETVSGSQGPSDVVG